MKKVSSSSKIRLKTAGQSSRSASPNTGKIARKKVNVDWAKGKSKGSGLDDYNLDLMTLE